MSKYVCFAKTDPGDNTEPCVLHMVAEDGTFALHVSRELFDGVSVNTEVEIPADLGEVKAGVTLTWEW